MSGKPRSSALLQLNQNKRNAAATLKARGKKANMSSMMALVKHRRSGKSNDDFFDALNSSTAEAVSLASGAASAANTTAKKERTPAQAAANARRRNAIAALKAQGLKANSASVKRYLNGQLASGAAAAAVVKNEVILEEEELENNSGIVPAVATAEVFAPAEKPTLSHSEAGKKAASSAKGAAWLEKIAKTRANVDKNFSNAGLTVKAPQANITKIASLRYTKQNNNAANNYVSEIIARAQSKAFNKTNKKSANKTVKKSSKKRNNSINRAIRNFNKRMVNRITRKKQPKYGTFNTSRRIPRENVNNRFQGSPNNFNIEELRNKSFNSAQ